MYKRLMLVAMLWSAVMSAASRSNVDTLVMSRVFDYCHRVETDTTVPGINIYTRYYMNTDRRNPLLWAVPTMYRVMRGKRREFAGETWSRLQHTADGVEPRLQVNVGTMPRHREVMTNVQELLRPRLYDVYLTSAGMLSPFHRINAIYYRYEVTRMSGGTAEVSFRPRVMNTQLVRGAAMVDPASGRVISVTLFGEFDMIRFSLSSTMGDSGRVSLYPQRCDMTMRFGFLGNRFEADYYSEYTLPTTLPDSIDNSHDMALMDSLRPGVLPERVERLYAIKDSLDSVAEAEHDTVQTEKRPSLAKQILWDSFADHLLNRTRMRLGQDEGYIRIDPLFNPLYFGYSSRKGVVYKVKVKAGYDFSDNSDLYVYFKGGYAFKWRQFYFRVPVRWTFNKQRRGYVELLVGNGNRITNSSVRDRIKEISRDSIRWNELDLEYFNDLHIRSELHYDVNSHWSVHGGTVFHRRSPVDKESFRAVHGAMDYRSFAPMVGVQWRPWGWKGVVITVDYERGIKGVAKSETEYERWEADAVWMKQLNPLRLLSVRVGAGLYTNRDNEAYFLDYANFNSEHIPGGWNDDWSGDFQLLDDHYYNASKYYLRGNITYETPLLLLYRLPWVGRFVESERIYINALKSTQVSPYMEYGYGFTNRLFSMGIFMATNKLKFDGFGFRFGFELFSRW